MLRARRLLLILVAACLVPLAASATETERFHKVVPFPDGGTLKLNNFSGDVRITGADVSEVTIDAVRRAERDRLDRIKLDVRVSGSTVEIEANKTEPGQQHENNNVVETEFDIRVPRGARLELKVFSSPVHVAGVRGSQSIDSFSGAVDVQDAPGHARIKTFSGRADVRLAPDAGDLDLDVHTFSGAIGLALPVSSRARVEFNTFSGELRSELPLTLERQSKRHLVGQLGEGGSGRVQLQTFSGSVDIDR